jgi:transcription elongation factor Elf1
VSEDRNLRILNPKNFVNPNNLMRIEAVMDDSDKQTKLSHNPHYAGLSYYSSSGRKYKDLASFLKKFRCKNCHVYGHMGTISTDKKSPNMIQALGCSNCGHIASLELPMDKNNLGKTSTGMDKRPNLVGKSTKFKEPISESEKLGLDKALRKNSPRKSPQKTRLLETPLDTIKSGDSMMKVIHKHLRRANLPMPTHSLIKSVYDVQDDDYNKFMQGKGIIKETMDFKPQDIQKRFSNLTMLY